MKMSFWRSGVLCSILVALAQVAVAEPNSPPARHRLFVLTDVENEPDDTQSLVRLMLYSNEIDLEGLVATTSIHMQKRVSPQSIHRVIAGYAKVRPSLLRHAAGFPSAEQLASLVKSGQPLYGMAAVGSGKETEGSDWLIECLRRNDERPLWVTAWGGPNTLAQALVSLQSRVSPEEFRRLRAKLRVYTISDQDDSGPWLRRTFPDLFYIVSPGGYGAAAWTGIMHVEPGFDNTSVSNRWLAENIQQGRGPLGALYPDVAYGMEGDTPSWLGLIPNGLGDPEHPEWGGWGGRYEYYLPELSSLDAKGFTGGVPVEPETRAIWTNTSDSVIPAVTAEAGQATRPGEKTASGFRIPIWRWRDDFQRDFAARMLWTTRSWEAANHPPQVVLGHDRALTVESGTTVVLDAHASTDPDGDSLSFWWFPYPEAGTCKTPVAIRGAANIASVTFTAPEVAARETLHFIVRVTDKGSPALARYARVIVTVVPRKSAS